MVNLTWLIAWPALAGLALFLFGKNTRSAQWANIAFQLVWALVAFSVLTNPAYRGAPGDAFPVMFSWNWLPELKSRFSLGLDGLNAPLIGLNVALAVVLAFYSLGKKTLGSGYLGLMSILNAASIGSLMAADALVFYFFWEFTLIPMYFLIGRWGSKGRVAATLKFFTFTMAGSLLMLVAIVALAFMNDVPSLGWHDMALLKLPFRGWMSPQGLLFIGFLAAFAVKIPVWPLHSWAPDAYTEAPTGGSIVLLKLGVYGIARWCLPLFPEAARASASVMMVLGCAGIVLGSLSAWRQSDMKRIIAYSSIAHAGFMVIGLFAFQPEALQGAMFQTVASGLSTAALFLVLGIVCDRTRTRELGEHGGLAINSGWLATAFVVATMASIGLPGLSGFVGEYLVLVGAYFSQPSAATVALLGVVLGAVYMLTLARKLVFGPQGPVVKSNIIKLSWNEWVAVVPLVLGMLYLGLQPQPFLKQAEQAVATAIAGLR